MFAIEVQTSFHATHALRLPRGGMEPAHTHEFHVTAKLTSPKLDEYETVIDFHIIEKLLTAIVHPWRGANLSQVEPFKSIVNPSAERIAEHLGQRLQAELSRNRGTALQRVTLLEIRLTEAVNCLAIWSPNA